jgi:hypothetical protein
MVGLNELMSAVRAKVSVPPFFAFGLAAAGFGAGTPPLVAATGDALGEADAPGEAAAATGDAAAAGDAAATGAIGLLVAGGAAAAAGEAAAAGALGADVAAGAGGEIGAQAAASPTPAVLVATSRNRRLVRRVVIDASPCMGLKYHL